MEIYKSKVYIANRYWNSKSYGIFSTEMLVIFPLLWLLKQSTIDFLKVPDVGNCWQTHSTNEFVSKAKSSMFLSRSSGNAILFVLVTTIEACKYSSFDFSSSPITPSAVYTLTCILDYYYYFFFEGIAEIFLKQNWSLTAGEERVPQQRANVTLGSVDSSP